MVTQKSATLVFYIVRVSKYKSSPCGCVCASVCKNAWLTRVHSQHFEMVPYNSPGTSGARPCIVTCMMIMTSMQNEPCWGSTWDDCQWRRVHVTSDCAGDRLYFPGVPRLVMGWVRARVYVDMIGLCRSIACNQTLHSIQPTTQDDVCIYVRSMLLMACYLQGLSFCACVCVRLYLRDSAPGHNCRSCPYWRVLTTFILSTAISVMIQ